MAVGAVTLIALVLFTIALCWRLDQIRRSGGGLQPAAMTIGIAALTLSVVIANPEIARAVNTRTFSGASRVCFYTLLAIGVAALIVVFFFANTGHNRQRRAGIEAVPLVAAVVGLNIAMQVTPQPVRTQSISEWTVQHIGFALFFVFAGCYLAYGLSATVVSVARYVRLAQGHMKIALSVLAVGLVALATGALIQTAFVALSGLGVVSEPMLLRVTAMLVYAGAVLFLIGVSIPMVRSFVVSWQAGRTVRRRTAELEPLWRLTTDAVPDVVLPSRPGASAPARVSAQMHFQRRVVEIRDALLQLSPYVPYDFDELPVAEQIQALRDAAEIYVEMGGAEGSTSQLLPATGDGDDASGRHQAVSVDADAEPLLRVSRAI